MPKGWVSTPGKIKTDTKKPPLQFRQQVLTGRAVRRANKTYDGVQSRYLHERRYDAGKSTAIEYIIGMSQHCITFICFLLCYSLWQNTLVVFQAHFYD